MLSQLAKEIQDAPVNRVAALWDEFEETSGIIGPVDPVPPEDCWRTGEVWLPQSIESIHLPDDLSETSITTPAALGQYCLFANRLPMGLGGEMDDEAISLRLLTRLRTQLAKCERLSLQREKEEVLGDHASRAIVRLMFHPERRGYFDLEQIFRQEEQMTGESKFERSADVVRKVAVASRSVVDRYAARSFAFVLATSLQDNLNQVIDTEFQTARYSIGERS